MSILRKLLPTSFRTRLILLILGAVLLAQALTIYAFAVYQQNQVQTAAVNLLVTSIQTVQAALGTMPANERAPFVNNVSHGQWQLLERDLPRHARFQSERGLEEVSAEQITLRRSLRQMARAVNRALDRGSRIAVTAGEQPFLYVSIPQTQTTSHRRSGQWLQIPLDRIDPPLTTPLLAAWLASLGVLLLGVVWFSWHITRPLTRLVHATDRLAAGQPEPVKPSGPDETRLLGEKFNTMLAALAQSQKTQRTLLAGLPHDLKGPLTRMGLRIEMSQDADLQAGLRRDLDDMQRMVEQFLAYLRGQDIDRFERQSIDLNDWFQLRMTDWSKLGKPIKWHKTDAKIQVLADPNSLDRLLSNLIDNALAHGEPPVLVTLTTEGRQAVLSVADQGFGIEPAHQSRVLEPFERADDARTRTGNVGLGLSIVQMIVNAHQGTLQMHQQVSGGFVVEVRLPLQED